MPVAVVNLPDGKRAKITFDDMAQLDETVDDLVKQHSDTGLAGKLARNPATEAIGETGLQMAYGMAGAAVGGVAGLARGAGAGIASLAQGEGLGKAGEAFAGEASDTIGSVERVMQYEPKTKAGKAASEAVSAPFTWLAKKADVIGEKVSDFVREGAEKVGFEEPTAAKIGAGAGTVANTAVQAAPALVTKGASMLKGAAAARETAAAPRITPTLEPEPTTQPIGQPQPQGAASTPAAPTPQPAPQLTASGAPRQPPSTVGAGPLPQKLTPQEAKAAEYARGLGLDWSRLGAGTRKALTTIAQDATALERLNPAAVKRQALLDSQRVPVPATRGQLTRDPAELRREAIVSRTEAGQPIRDTDVAANRAVQANLEALRGRAAGLKGGLHDPVNEEGVPAATPSIRAPTKLPSQVGQSTRAAVLEKAKWSKKAYDALFKRARETEPNARASLQSVTDLLTENPEIQHLGWVENWLNKGARVKAPEGGKPVAMTDATLKELSDLRSTATNISKTGGKEGYYAGQVARAIDKAMESVPAGAKAWKTALDAYKKHQREFSDQDTVSALASETKGGINPKIPLQRTWDRLAKGPVENLRQVKRTMLTGGTPKTREIGRRAWRDLRGETVNRILEGARKLAATDEKDNPIVTARALEREMNSIPRENLEELIGKANVRELKGVIQAARSRTPPGSRTTESGTVPNMLIMAEKILGHFPGGQVVVGAAKKVKELHEMGKAGETVRRATTSPLDEAAQKASTGPAKRAQQYRDLESGPSLPP